MKTSIVNDTGRNLTIYAVVLRWDYTTFEQRLTWPMNKTISEVLEKYQEMLGSPKDYKIIEYTIEG